MRDSGAGCTASPFGDILHDVKRRTNPRRNRTVHGLIHQISVHGPIHQIGVHGLIHQISAGTTKSFSNLSPRDFLACDVSSGHTARSRDTEILVSPDAFKTPFPRRTLGYSTSRGRYDERRRAVGVELKAPKSYGVTDEEQVRVRVLERPVGTQDCPQE